MPMRSMMTRKQQAAAPAPGHPSLVLPPYRASPKPRLDRRWLEADSEDSEIWSPPGYSTVRFFQWTSWIQTMCRTLQQLGDHCYALLFIITLLLPIYTSLMQISASLLIVLLLIITSLLHCYYLFWHHYYFYFYPLCIIMTHVMTCFYRFLRNNRGVIAYYYICYCIVITDYYICYYFVITSLLR